MDKTLSPKQQEALDELLPIARMALDSSTAQLPIKPRTHSLICAPSGAGKSHLMNHLGDILNVPVLRINVSTWAPMGGKSSPYTWDKIATFLSENAKGIILLDEIDKISSNSDWQGYVRLELHELLDGEIPQAVTIPGEVDTSDIW